MGSHPINLTVRFLLELSTLMAVGMWGWRQSDSWLKFVLAVGVPILLAAIWGTFSVPDDPSRSGAAPTVTPGAVRLIIELGFFAIGTWSLFNLGYSKLSLGFGVMVLLHYTASYDRITWLLNQ